QPLGKPPLISYLTCHLRLYEILEMALRRLYEKTKTRKGWTGVEWEQRTVAELDSATNDFFNSIPPIVRIPRFSTIIEVIISVAYSIRSSELHATFYYTQIIIHRPYILKPSVLPAPSLSICTNAARSILQTGDIWLNQVRQPPLPCLLVR
ncbi:hypothetical protein C8R43DRAFT_878596, partial [Mycena crocata]